MKNTQKALKKDQVFDLPIHLVILKEELDRRIRTNPNYSLRSFAKHLGTDPSLLSKILNNLRPLSTALAAKILERLNLGDAEKNLFWKSLVRTKEDQISEVKAALKISHEENHIDQEVFKVIAEPHHYTIVELSRLKAFSADPAWLSNILGVSAEEAEEAVARLILVGMLRREDGCVSRGSGRFTTKDKTVTDSAHKLHQKKILEKAIRAMDEVPLELRNQSSMTIAVNPKKIPIAKKMIQEFINELSDVLEAGPLEEVYQISLSLFPLTQVEESKARA